ETRNYISRGRADRRFLSRTLETRNLKLETMSQESFTRHGDGLHEHLRREPRRKRVDGDSSQLRRALRHPQCHVQNFTRRRRGCDPWTSEVRIGLDARNVDLDNFIHRKVAQVLSRIAALVMSREPHVRHI